MKTIVFGATGETGLCLVSLLISSGHQVTVYVRNPQKLASMRDKINIIQGTIDDKKAMQSAISGQEIVLSTFGNRSLKKSNTQETFMSNLVESMDKTHVTRLIDLSAWGVGDSYKYNNLIFKFIQATLLKANFDDKNKAETILLSSKIDYTLVRPARLTKGPAKGSVRAAVDNKGLNAAPISREDVARFMVDQIQNSTWSRQTPLISY